jgi:Tol biopolymer transport system component
MPLAPGTSIGAFKVVSALGAGGMGEVYRARDTRLKRDVALKVLPEAFANDRERLARITREAEVLASLNHPNIATIYGVEEGALVMELVEGAPPRGPMSFDEAWKIAAQIASALEYAHERGIVHRDLKPANVMVTPDGVVKLLDFGLAKAFTEPGASTSNPEQSPTLTLGATQLGTILGTAAYMAPEQAKGKTVDKRADIWAFGVLLYELLSGQRLFKGDDISDTLAQVLTKEPDLNQTPAKARKLLARCLQKDPKQRLRDIGEAVHNIEEPPVAAVPRAGTSWLAWAIAVVALLLAGAAYWLRPAVEHPIIRTFILPPAHTVFHSQGDYAGPAVLSPDGKRLAFSAGPAGGKPQLWVRALDSETAQALAGTDGGLFPFWSPDSRTLGFFTDEKLKRVDAGGGSVHELADVTTARGGAWNRDDVIVFAPNFTSALLRIPAAGGTPTPVTHLDVKRHEISHRWPAFLPDGKHFLYTSRDQGVFVAALEGLGEPKKLLPDSSNAFYSSGYLLYAHGNTLLARPFDAGRREFTGAQVTVVQPIQSEGNSDRACFTASNQGLLAYHAGLGESQLTWFDRAGNRVGTLGSPGLFRGVEISPDGKRAAVVVDGASGGAVVWIYDLDRGVRTRLSTAASFSMGLAWSPHGKQLALGGPREGGYAIYAKDTVGSGSEEVLFRSDFEVLLYGWTAKGISLSTRNPKTGWDFAYIPVDHDGADRKAVPVVQEDANELVAQVSNNGRWAAYLSDASGQLEAWVTSFPGGGNRRQVSTSGADFVRWSAGDREILFTNRTKLMAAPVQGNADRPEVGTAKLLFEVRVDCSILEISCFDKMPDGKRFLVIEPVGGASPVALIQNWTASLKN